MIGDIEMPDEREQVGPPCRRTEWKERYEPGWPSDESRNIGRLLTVPARQDSNERRDLRVLMRVLEVHEPPLRLETKDVADLRAMTRPGHKRCLPSSRSRQHPPS